MTTSRKIYLASSWKHDGQPALVEALRAAGHAVYDFRNPAPGKAGFAWSQIDPDWQTWGLRQFVENLRSPIAAAAFALDANALRRCDTCILLLPSGRSAHLEAGFAAGQGKNVIVMLSADEPAPNELMYLFADALVTDTRTLLAELERTPRKKSKQKSDGGFGVVRYAPGTGVIPEDDVACFDGWYARKAEARDVYADWRRRFPGWVVAIVGADAAHMHFGGGDFELIGKEQRR